MHAKHSGRLTECILVGETEVKSYFQSPIRIRTSDLLARFRLARCVSNESTVAMKEFLQRLQRSGSPDDIGVDTEPDVVVHKTDRPLDILQGDIRNEEGISLAIYRLPNDDKEQVNKRERDGLCCSTRKITVISHLEQICVVQLCSLFQINLFCIYIFSGKVNNFRARALRNR